MRKRPVQRAQEASESHSCRECSHVTVVTDFHTLTINGQKPTLGRCPYYTGGKYCVILSQKSCEHFKAR